MPTADSVKAKLQGLIDKANSTTGETDTTVTQAVDRLIEGYGSGGGGDDFYKAREKSILDRSITEFVDDEITTLGNSVFSQCRYLERVVAPNVTFADGSVFHSCAKLAYIDMPNLEKMHNYNTFFGTAVSKLVFPKLSATAGWSFAKNTALEYAEFAILSKFLGNDFNGCSALKTVILRKSDGICTLGNAAVFTNTPIASGTGYVYVPSALVEDYKAATNWSTYADQIRAIEDYPEITAEEEESE